MPLLSNTVKRLASTSLPPRSSGTGPTFRGGARRFGTSRSGPSRSPNSRWVYLAGGGLLLSTSGAMLAEPSLSPEEQLETCPRAPVDSLTSTPTSALIRSYLVYTACSIPFLIDYAPSLLNAFTKSPIPGLGALTEFIVRHTFFAQFVPGETVGECLPSMHDLRARKISAVLNYSAEADDEGKADVRHLEKQRLEEVYRAITAMGTFEDEVVGDGGKRGSSAFALKIVRPLLITGLTFRPASSTPRSSLAHPLPSSGFVLNHIPMLLHHQSHPHAFAILVHHRLAMLKSSLARRETLASCSHSRVRWRRWEFWRQTRD